MTKLTRIIEADRKVAAYRFRMSGVVTKKHFIDIAREFGIVKAIRVLLSGRGTALTILMS
jgi:hypothetical protein